ncbi:MAG: ATP-dependent Clp protease ATP-binding subunit ClpX, partial [bacterium]
ELDNAEVIRKLMPEDLLRYGFIPEFVGRFPVVAPVDPLSVDDLVKVLTEPKNSLVKQYTELFRMEGVTLEFSRGALQEIARLAQERGSGARGLRSILESLMLDLMYEMPETKDLRRVVISSAVVKGKIRPRYIYETDVEPAAAAGGGG